MTTIFFIYFIYLFIIFSDWQDFTHPNKNPTKYEPVRQRVTGSRAGLTSYRQLCVYFPWAGANRLDVTAPGKHKQSPRCSETLLRGSSNGCCHAAAAVAPTAAAVEV